MSQSTSVPLDIHPWPSVFKYTLACYQGERIQNVNLSLPVLLHEAIVIAETKKPNRVASQFTGLREVFRFDGDTLWYGHTGITLSTILYGIVDVAEGSMNYSEHMARIGLPEEEEEGPDSPWWVMTARTLRMSKPIILPFYGPIRARNVLDDPIIVEMDGGLLYFNGNIVRPSEFTDIQFRETSMRNWQTLRHPERSLG